MLGKFGVTLINCLLSIFWGVQRDKICSRPWISWNRSIYFTSIICSRGFNRDSVKQRFFHIWNAQLNRDRTYLYIFFSFLFAVIALSCSRSVNVAVGQCLPLCSSNRKNFVKINSKSELLFLFPTVHKTEHYKTCAIGVQRTLSSVRNLFFVILFPQDERTKYICLVSTFSVGIVHRFR